MESLAFLRGSHGVQQCCGVCIRVCDVFRQQYCDVSVLYTVMYNNKAYLTFATELLRPLELTPRGQSSRGWLPGSQPCDERVGASSAVILGDVGTEGCFTYLLGAEACEGQGEEARSAGEDEGDTGLARPGPARGASAVSMPCVPGDPTQTLHGNWLSRQ